MPDDNDDFLPSDIPHDVVIQEALAQYFGGFEEAEEASKAAHRALVVTYRRAIVETEDLRAAFAHWRRPVTNQLGGQDAYDRLRAALPEGTTTDEH